MEAKFVTSFIISDTQLDVNSYPNFLFIREDRVVGEFHLEAAMKYAISSFIRKRNISDTIQKEILIYLSLQRQVFKAIDIMGIKNYTGKIIVIGEKEFPWDKKFRSLDITHEKLDFWGIKDPLEILTKMAAFHVENA